MKRAQRRRRNVLSRQLKASDDQFDALATQRDQLNALVELLGNELMCEEIAVRYAELERLESLDEQIYQPLDDELRRLDALKTYRLLDALLATAIVVAIVVRWTTWPMRRIISRMRRRAPKPKPPGNDGSFQILLPGGCI